MLSEIEAELSAILSWFVLMLATLALIKAVLALVLAILAVKAAEIALTELKLLSWIFGVFELMS